MNVQAVFKQALELGITVQTDGVDLIYRPKTATPPEFVETLRANKASLIEYLKRYRRVYPGDEVGASELEEIARRVEKEGYVLLWSDVLDDSIAFYNADADRAKIPAGFVSYSNSELQELLQEDRPDWSLEELRRIHMAKKIAAFKVTEVRDD